MRNLIIFLFALIISSRAFAEEIKVSVNGMVCSFCAQGIKKTFSKEPEVQNVSPDLENKLVIITTKEGQTLSDLKITELIENAGYNVTKIERKS